MDWWDPLIIAAIVVYIFTWRGFGPIGQPKNPPFPIWPKIGALADGQELARLALAGPGWGPDLAPLP
jgi:hypothetical protein